VHLSSWPAKTGHPRRRVHPAEHKPPADARIDVRAWRGWASLIDFRVILRGRSLVKTGGLKGRIHIAADFEAPLPDEMTEAFGERP
jgi:hypothetical protein